jgi:thymidine kinase
MFSGKSSELIRRLTRYQYAKKHVEVFKPCVDNRYSVDHLCTHTDQRLQAIPIPGTEMPNISESMDVIGIDEVQFFDKDIVGCCLGWAKYGIHVIVAGLDLDYHGEPFDVVAKLMPYADEVVKLSAVCMVCGKSASRTQRISASTDRIAIGGMESYEARCIHCFGKV